MIRLIVRAIRYCSNEGLYRTAVVSVRFILLTFRHWIGLRYFYTNSMYVSLLAWWNGGRGRYSRNADPFKILWIDPTTVEFVTGRDPFPGRFQWQQIGLVRGGDWDNTTTRFDDLPTVQGLYSRYQNGREWNETAFIHQLKRQIESDLEDPDWRRVRSHSDLEKACKKVDDLFARINEEGYKTTSQLLEEDKNALCYRSLPNHLLQYDEVAVDIGRDGEFLFVDGRHRLAIAKILGLDEIPVRVSTRHAEWQRVRERIGDTADPRTELPSEVTRHLDHPDLADLLGR